MKTSRTFKGASKPYGKEGWFREPMRHALASRGIRTGVSAKTTSPKPYYIPEPYGLPFELTPKDAFRRLKDTDKDGVPDKYDCQPHNPNHQDAPKTFRINDRIAIVAEYKKARDGFNHFATLYIDGNPVDSTKVHYINRTREEYDFQSAMQQLVDGTKDLNADEKAMARDYLKKDHSDSSNFKMTAMVARLGDIMTSSKKESNDWKERMIKAGLGNKGLDMPEDWDKLDENTKQARLNAVIKVMGEPTDYGNSPPTHEIQQEYELPVEYGSAKSFYGKANVRGVDGRTVLRSYGTDVAYIKDGKAHVSGTYSQTTLRHIKEFLKQNGFKADSSSQIMKDYGKEE